MSANFKIDASKLLSRLESTETRSMAAIRMFAETGATKLESAAKENARWQDRTGHARQRLKGDALPVAKGYKLRLAHGVDYGKWLELAHERRFAIIEETIEYVGTFEIMPGFKKLLNRLGRVK